VPRKGDEKKSGGENNSGSFCYCSWKTLDWEKKGGAILNTHQKQVLARFHIFLKSPMLEKPIAFLRKISALPYQQIGPTD
jgi:hypothetical protein